MSKMEQVKKFIKERKKEITIVVGAIVGGTALYKLGAHVGANKAIDDIMISVPEIAEDIIIDATTDSSPIE
jgi:copper homeostasis protein CutC